MKVLVTGAAGALGRLVCDRLAADRTVELFRTDRLPSSTPGHFPCDITDPAAVTDLIGRTRPDRIFHLAGSASGEFERDRAVNADGARFLCEAACALALSARIVVIGSAAEYGLVAPAENPVVVETLTTPVKVLFPVTCALYCVPATVCCIKSPIWTLTDDARVSVPFAAETELIVIA